MRPRSIVMIALVVGGACTAGGTATHPSQSQPPRSTRASTLGSVPPPSPPVFLGKVEPNSSAEGDTVAFGGVDACDRLGHGGESVSTTLLHRFPDHSEWYIRCADGTVLYGTTKY
jgi:hypothetical protein